MKNCTLWFLNAKGYGAFLITLILSASLSAQVVNTESFDGTTFPPAGWQQSGSNTSYLFRTTSGSFPTQNPHSGAGEVEFNSYSLTGNTFLISPPVDWSHLGTDSAYVSFWFYRDGTRYLSSTYYTEGVTVAVNTTATQTGATLLGFVPRIDTLAPVADSTGWFKYTYSVPRTFNTNTNYIIFRFIGKDGDNCFMDDVSWPSFPTPCSGTPVAGLISSSLNPVCPVSQFTLTLDSGTIGSGLSYQWQSSADSLNWTNLVGDTTTSINDTLIANTYYRAVVTCNNSGLADTSAVYYEKLNPFYNCYCVVTSNCNANDEINNVTFSGINNSSVCGTNGYTQYDSVATVQLTVTYPISVSVNNGGIENVSVWIDYDHSGTFDPSEYVAVGSGQGGVTFTNHIYIPANALTGVTRMRVRDSYSSQLPPQGACNSVFDGETEDYLVNILPAPICSNPPSAGTIAGAGSVCSGDSLTLSLTGQTLGTAVQWQSSADSLTFTNIAGATSPFYTTVPVTAATFYRVKITCADSVYTPVVKVAVNPFYQCYCSEPGIQGNSACGNGYEINSVSITGTTLSTSGVCNVVNGYTYTLFPDTGSSTATLDAPATYTIVVAGTNAGGYMSGWIDFNRDGIYDASENIFLNQNTSGGNDSYTFNVPANATLGITGMRIRSNSYSISNTDACTSFFNGETEDYVINIIAAPACTGRPAAGSIVASLNPICPSVPFTLNLQNSLVASGLKYQWQSSTDSLNWTSIAGDTTNSITDNISVVTYYRFILTCLNSGQSDTTAVLTETLNGFANCYCTPVANCQFNDVITNVTFAGINNTSACSGTGYTLYNDTASVIKTFTYPISVTVTNGGTENTYIWIDYNHNGLYEDSEFVAIGSGTGGVTFSNSITIPANALSGVTGMRIRDKYGSPIVGTDACTTVSDGETEDYFIDIEPIPVCTNPPAPGAISGGGNICSGDSVSLRISGETLGTALQWQISTDSLTFTNVAGATSTTFTTGAITAVTYFRVKVICADSSYTPVFIVSLNPTNLCNYCAVTSDCSLSDEITNVTFAGINNTSDCSGTGYTRYSLTATVQQNQTYPIAVSVNNGGTENAYAWIDYNHNGVFDSSEYTVIGSGAGGVTFTSTITIPANALLGVTTMRIRDAYGSTPPLTDTGACTIVNYGETEDYLVNITAAPCTNPAVVGTVTGPATSYPDSIVTYHVTHSNGTLQWIYSTVSASGPFTAIPGATDSVLTLPVPASGIYYVAVVASTQAGCTPDTSNIVVTNALIAGDNVCNAIALHTGGNGPFNTAYASVEPGEPAAPAGSCTSQNTWCTANLHNSLWFTFVAPASGRVSINTVSFDTKIAVWDAATCDTILHGGARLIAANDNDAHAAIHGINSGASYLDSVSCLTPGRTYYVQLLPETAPGDTTSIVLRYLSSGPNANFTLALHVCQNATPISLSGITAGGLFSGPGVRNNVFYPDSALTGTPIVITDSFYSCYVAHQTVVINAAPVVTAGTATPVLCHGGNTGKLSISVSGGTAPYHYSWTNGATTDSIAQLTGGYYVATVTDSAGCSTKTDSLLVAQPDSFYIVLDTLIESSCQGGATGAVYIHATGGTGSYHYNWSNSASSQNIINLPPTGYSVTASDQNACSTTALYTVAEQALFNVVTSITNQQQSGTLGSISQNPTGGVAPYHYAWSSGDSSKNLAGLQAGIYTSTITDAAGCVVVISDTVKLDVGIESLYGIMSFNVFPNPAQNNVYVDLDLDKAETVTLQVYDVSGRLISFEEQNATVSARFNIDLHLEAAGVYMIRVKAGEALLTRRVVLTK